ncbi:hypothetical protein [Pseudogulbenkiania sp. NH8B]|uniref:hypothetical protein n=1 Tax=Pseudogulbenkiania sp. (strain NH8B) TaxID=748280 RepID=UPI0011D21C78|nr:hypothetical protein [Pseudogulbenkiania sp. NH8B]
MRKSEFADFLGVTRGYVSQLAKADRLVLSSDGQQVRVRESLDKLAATGNVDKVGVSARHALERLAKGGSGVNVQAAIQSAAGLPLPNPAPATTWLVPAGAWSWDGLTPMGRITRLAEAAGGIVFGQPGERVLSVLPRTPVMPEAWADATPDLILPDAVMETLGEEWDETPAYNAVIVTGERQGVTARVKRTGTAGDAIAPTVVDALITHPDPARHRGMDVLAQGGSAARVSVSLPMLDGLGLVLPGTFVSVTGADPFRAMSRGVRVSAEWKDALVVRQTLDLERRD